jgi:acetoin utilization protein AcuB
MEGVPRIKTVMTPFPTSVEPDATPDSARRTMAEHGIRHLPVVRGREIVGVVRERDLRDAGGAATVGDLCAPDPYIVDILTPLDQVLLAMAKGDRGSALVVKEERLVGIFTTTDACRCFGEFLQGLGPTGDGGDAA